jgi:hypothetical protein
MTPCMKGPQMSKATVIHPWEHEGVIEALRIAKKENAKLKAYASYIANRMTAHVTAVNERVTDLKELPFVAAAMLDDLDDAVTVSGLSSDPRTWKP